MPERYQDAVTAISGTGPAYLFFVVEAMIEAGVHLGLPRILPRSSWSKPCWARPKLLRETGEHPTVLRERVTSPGGTTAAACTPARRSQGASSVLGCNGSRPRPQRTRPPRLE